MYRHPVTSDNLNDVMEFDHVIAVHDDGTVTDGPAGVHAPDLLDDQLSGPGWSFFSTGYSGQDSYRGPIMHDSEFIGGGLARDILATPGIYAAVVAYWSPDEDDDETTTEGWAIVRLDDAARPDEIDQSKPQARGHLIRTGHKLTGYYVPTDDPGIVRLVRTCACADA